MLRPDINVAVRWYKVWEEDGVVKREATNETSNYTVQSVHVNFDSTITFFCSGKPFTVPAEDVVRITYTPSSASWCAFCDQSISHFSLPQDQAKD